MTATEETNHKRQSRRSGATFVFREDGPMAQVLQQVEKYAPISQPVLITGETGTGKEQVAKLLHAHSERPGRLVSVNLSAIPHDLIENELFGHLKGSFSGADTTTTGYVERASEGSLFLDEVGDIALQNQVKLLRLIENGVYEKIGSQRSQTSTARFIFATNRLLEDDVASNRFRSDLYYRISTFTIFLPSLRERKDDIPLLIDHFLYYACDDAGRHTMTISDEALKRLIQYDWPGNVRELENIVYRLVATVHTDCIDIEHLPSLFQYDQFVEKKRQFNFHRSKADELEKELIDMALLQSDGNLTKAAQILGMSRNTFQYRLNKTAAGHK